MLLAIDKPSRWRAPTASATAWNMSTSSLAVANSQNQAPWGNSRDNFRRHLQRQPGLADTAHAGQCHQPLLAQHVRDLRDVAFPADDVSWHAADCPGTRRATATGRTPAASPGAFTWNSAFRPRQIAQSMLTQIDQPDTFTQTRRRATAQRSRATPTSAHRVATTHHTRCRFTVVPK